MKLLLTAFCLTLAFSLHAEDQTMTVRVIGLSDPSRVEDFRKTMMEVPELKLVSLDAAKTSAAISYDPMVLVNKPKPKPEELAPEKMLGFIDNLIGKASVRTFSVTAPTGIAEDKLTRLDIKVGVLDCKSCRYGAYIAVAKIEGVERASVKGEILSVWIDVTKTSREALEAALKKAHVELPTP